MKNLFILLLFISTTVGAQQPCTNVVPPQQFNQFYAQVSHTQGDKYKMNLMMPWTNTHCITCAQMQQLALLLNNDDNRFEYIKTMLGRLADFQNKYVLIDAFKQFSTAFMLYDYFNAAPTLPPPPPPPLPTINFPNCNNYNGLRGCDLPLADNDFDLLTRNFNSLPNEGAVEQTVRDFATKNCISMAQAMKLSLLLQMESSRLAFLKSAFPKVFDMGNYSYASDVFSSQQYKATWISYCQGMLMPPPPPVNSCMVTENEMTSIKKSIEKEVSSSVQLSITRQVLSAKKCFTVSQIKELVMLQSFESGKLEIAKYAYDYCINKENYYQVADAFSFSSSKEDLMNYIKTKH